MTEAPFPQRVRRRRYRRAAPHWTTSKVIRVLNVLHEERFGGPQARVLNVAVELRARGFETIVAIPRGDPMFASLLRAENIQTVELDLVRLRNSMNPFAHARFLRRFWPNVLALRRTIHEHNVRLIHANGLSHLQSPIAARLERIGLLWHLNDITTPRLLRRACVPLARRWADQIAVAAHAVGDHYFPSLNHGRERIEVLYAPVNTDEFNPRVSGAAVRSELGIGPDCAVVGTVGNIHPGKGIEFFLEAAVAIKKSHPQTRFLVVGERLANQQPYGDALRRRAAASGLSDQVIFTGRRNDMPAVMAAMTVYVHPSLFEACPMAVLEASATGLPLVATDVGGTRELVEDGATGFLVAPRAPEPLTRKVVSLLRSPARAAEMGRQGARRISANFSLQACVAQHVTLYERVLRHRRAGSGKTL